MESSNQLQNYSFDDAISGVKNLDDVKRIASDFVEKLIESYQRKQKRIENVDLELNKKIRTEITTSTTSSTNSTSSTSSTNSTSSTTTTEVIILNKEIEPYQDSDTETEPIVGSRNIIQSDSNPIAYFKCNFCDYKVRYKHNLVNHFLRYHATKEQRIKSFKYYCKICDLGFNYISSLESHLNTKSHERHKRFLRV